MILTEEQKIVCCTILECNSCGYPKGQFLATLREKGIEFPLSVIKTLSQLGLVRYDVANGKSRKEGVFKPLRPLWDMQEELLNNR